MMSVWRSSNAAQQCRCVTKLPLGKSPPRATIPNPICGGGIKEEECPKTYDEYVVKICGNCILNANKSRKQFKRSPPVQPYLTLFVAVASKRKNIPKQTIIERYSVFVFHCTRHCSRHLLAPPSGALVVSQFQDPASPSTTTTIASRFGCCNLL